MVKVLILGANGQLARNTTRVFLERSDAHLTLYLRRASRLKNPDPSRTNIIEGDVLDLETLKAAMPGQDAVYANLAGAMAQQAKTIVVAARYWPEAADLHQLDGYLWGSAGRNLSERAGPLSRFRRRD